MYSSEEIAASPYGLLAMTSYIQNKSPFAFALGDCFSEDFLLISKASPNGWLAIIIVIIIIGEAVIVFHKLAYYSTIKHRYKTKLPRY